MAQTLTLPTRLRARLLCGALTLSLGVLALHAAAQEANPDPRNKEDQFSLDVEGGFVLSGYNRIQIPGSGEGGAGRFNMNNLLDQGTTGYFRVRPGYTFKGRHTILALFAPLNVTYSGTLSNPLVFNGRTFDPDRPTRGRYQFNSYRLTYRYNLILRRTFMLGLGITGKVRDAYIELDDGRVRSRKSDLGIVPLINFYSTLRLGERTGLIFEGDALYSFNGRATDAFLGAYWTPFKFLSLKGGYRMLEGGADNDEVFNFSMFHYFGIGAILRL